MSIRDWDAVIREFEIIGEATKQLLKLDLLNADSQKIVDFRNRISHGYFAIDPQIVWQIIEELPRFKSVIINEIDSLEKATKELAIESYIQDNHYLNFIVQALENLKESQ